MTSIGPSLTDAIFSLTDPSWLSPYLKIPVPVLPENLVSPFTVNQPILEGLSSILLTKLHLFYSTLYSPVDIGVARRRATGRWPRMPLWGPSRRASRRRPRSPWPWPRGTPPPRPPSRAAAAPGGEHLCCKVGGRGLNGVRRISWQAVTWGQVIIHLIIFVIGLWGTRDSLDLYWQQFSQIPKWPL